MDVQTVSFENHRGGASWRTTTILCSVSLVGMDKQFLFYHGIYQ